jgi:hypothetical protein
MEPSSEELRAFGTVADIATWVQLPGDIPETESPLGALFAALGIDEQTHWRVVAAMATDSYDAVLETLTYVVGPAGEEVGDNEVRFTPALRSQAGLIGRYARVCGGVEPSFADAAIKRDVDAAHVRAVQLATASAQAAPTTTIALPPPTAKAASSGRTVPMKDIVDGARSDEQPVMQESEFQKFRSTSKSFMHRFPPWDSEPTIEQLSAVQVLVKEHAPPYVDLALFGPHGQRTLRSLKLHGLVPGPNGVLQRVETRGPPTIASWCLCMEVFKSVVIGLNILTLPTIDDYIAKGSQLHAPLRGRVLGAHLPSRCAVPQGICRTCSPRISR